MTDTQKEKTEEGQGFYAQNFSDFYRDSYEKLEKQMTQGSASMAFTLHNFDRWLHAAMGRFTLGLSPAALTYAFMDWSIHLSTSPGKQAELIERACHQWMRLFIYASHIAADSGAPRCVAPLPQDQRFEDKAWCEWPYNLIYQSFLLSQQWWQYATTNVRGVSKHHTEVVSFAMRQVLDVFSPSNFVLTNPEVLHTTLMEKGGNIIRGYFNLAEDWQRSARGKGPLGVEGFRPGEKVALTPGKVIYKNHLMELIQYAPTTKTVHPEPILITPAWIMKYYILDLSPKKSLVKYLVDRGYTVFMVSWRNPTSEDRSLGMDDYRMQGIMTALDVISKIIPDQKIHGVGYCLGGTLLSTAAAAMARDGTQKLKSVTLLAAQTDFSEAGELTLFIDESQITFLEDIMWEQGVLDAKQMSGAFQLLRSKDLIWSRMIHDYLLGKRKEMFDLMAWNSDATRLPYKMHTEYLRKLFFNNELAEGHYHVQGRPIVLSDIRIPIFSVATATDHISPWRSVYKIHLLTDTDVSFLLTSGGHNAGIVSEPGHPRRVYQYTTRRATDKYTPPDLWHRDTPIKKGSWWPEWSRWLTRHSEQKRKPPPMGNPKKGYPPLYDAPGQYVLEE